MRELRFINAWSLIVVARVFLAVFALLAVYADPHQPVRSADLTYYLLAGYVVYSLALVLLAPRRSPGDRDAVAVHIIDLIVFSSLAFLTEGPTSPFFPFFTFALFSAALNWSWRGVAVSAFIIISIYGYLTSQAEINPGEDVARTIMRGAYVVVASVLFVYFSAILERERKRFEQLAAWPAAEASTTGFPDLHPLLKHISEVTHVPWLLVIWEDRFEPHMSVAEFDLGSTKYAVQTMCEVDLDKPQADTAQPVIYTAGVEDSVTSMIARQLKERGIGRAVVAPIRGSNHLGWLVMGQGYESERDLIAPASIAALRLGFEIDYHQIRQDLLDAAVREGRSRFARDIHDSLLQSLAAVSLQIKFLEAHAPAAIGERLADIRATIVEQQKSLRKLIASGRTIEGEGSQDRNLAAELAELLQGLEKQWKCQTTLSADPPNMTVSALKADALLLFVEEFVANSIRHGGATCIQLEIVANGPGLTLTLRDNGTGLHGLAGSYSHGAVIDGRLGSASLRQRAQEMSANIELVSSPSGLGVRLELAT